MKQEQAPSLMEQEHTHRTMRTTLGRNPSLIVVSIIVQHNRAFASRSRVDVALCPEHVLVSAVGGAEVRSHVTITSQM